ncbi:hypothetical protein BU24DRAFT_205 [Aaosphaeria arxii CBS 175.79]|uniref:Uncharacterized protein n=1 Tax=Aaosphaeria arxii CBS 175.79 TaxID=1450172 RepID=A0A6A5Y455_9PLEO|nr:uncharacterized protein BU24DRAFT_205 [Aaosphaeria arxii CBS 175.79]KAF2020355.1 hypothetical protein BU24DRAFT_205 [Aaosphaeria arxii CBS 175.79]
MAHQAHALPWQTLTDNFKFVHANTRFLGRTNLYPRSKPGQAKQLQHFARVFARVIDEYSAIERKKYGDEHTPPESGDEVVISDETMKKIHNVVKEYMKEYTRWYPDSDRNLFDRTANAWIRVSNERNGHPDECLLSMDELLRTLIMFGEMDTLFCLAAHPEIRLRDMWAQGNNFHFDLGGLGPSELKEAALLAYICLNVFYLKPELYDPAMREQMLKERAKRNEKTWSPELYDYRLTAAYQQMLVYTTGTGYPYPHFGAHKIPHREFYGVPFGMYTSQVAWYSNINLHLTQKYGTLPLQDLVDKDFPQKYVPSKGDMPKVHDIFRALKLPTEITLAILDFADYTPRGRLNTHADPLHIDNASELKKYLAYCWKLLIRVDMLMKAAGTHLDWEHEATEAIYKLFGVPYPQMSKEHNRPQEDEQYYPYEYAKGKKREFV